MKQFNKDNLYNIHKLDPKLVDMFNETLKKYQPEHQEAYFDLITSIDKDYKTLRHIEHSSYLYEMAKEPYTDFEALENYHNAMLSVNETNDYSDLYYLLKDNSEVEDFVNNYMLENNIYPSDELYNMVDEDLKQNGLESDYKYLIDKVENDPSTYSQPNAYGNDIEIYNETAEVFKEVYEDSFDIIDRYYFEDLEIEPTPSSPGGKDDVEEPEM